MSQKYVTKRDGRQVAFDKSKIENVVELAFIAVDGKLTPYAIEKAKNIANYIESKFNETDDDFSVEDVQDFVERGLMSAKRKDVAKAFILYREKRSAERNRNRALTKQIGKKLSGKDVQNQNANVDERSFGGRIGEASSAVNRDYAINYCLSDMARENHLNNMIYIHDLDHYAVGDHNCLSVPFDKLLKNGFKTRQTDVRPANSINTAFQLVAVIFQLQSLMQFGGVSATHLDWTMVPYVRKSFNKHFRDAIEDLYDREADYEFEKFPERPIDDPEYVAYDERAAKIALRKTERELKQAVEGMYHNLK